MSNNLTNAIAALNKPQNTISVVSAGTPTQSIGNQSGDMRKDIAAQIKTERKYQGMSQWQLGHKAGYCSRTISNVERGWSSYYTVTRVIAALGKELTLK